jgi:hypothetical protein
MALKKTTTTSQGFEAENAYHRVEGLSLLNKENITFRVSSYKDQSSNSFEEKSYLCSYDINGENPIKQAYLHLKILPEFAGAVDC